MSDRSGEGRSRRTPAAGAPGWPLAGVQHHPRVIGQASPPRPAEWLSGRSGDSGSGGQPAPAHCAPARGLIRAELSPKARAGRARSPTVLHVLKYWAAWPRRIRWLVGIAAVVLALAIVWALFVPLADWLAHHDVGSATGPLHETALDNARGRLLTLAAGLLAAGALVFTARNFTLSREGHVTDRYTKAARAARLGQARRAHCRHLRTGTHRSRLSQRPPHRDGGSHRVHPRALSRAAALAVAGPR